MSKVINTSIKVSCSSEYDVLKSVILCSPEYMEIRDVINTTQRHYIRDNINSSQATKQHAELLQVLKNQHVDFMLLPTKRKYPEQVFTRDIGFTIGSSLFTARMKKSIRQGEEQILINQLQQKCIPFVPISECCIEGGDVIIDGNKIWIGDSDRTSLQAINKLQTLLPQYQFFSIPFDARYLHLDCVFNVISTKDALIFPPAFTPSVLDILLQHYNCIEVNEEEQFTLGTNVLSLGNKKIISLPQNKKVNILLRQRGFEIIDVDISEIIKSGGSFRCITLPILRE